MELTLFLGNKAKLKLHDVVVKIIYNAVIFFGFHGKLSIGGELDGLI